jgi:hypothetical protein
MKYEDNVEPVYYVQKRKRFNSRMANKFRSKSQERKKSVNQTIENNKPDQVKSQSGIDNTERL